MALDPVSLGLAAAALGGVAEAKTYTDTKIGELSEGLTYKGSVATVSDLPASGNEKGDCYNVTDGSGMYAWNGTSWGSASKAGPTGPTGEAAGFGAPIASATSVEYGEPASASVTASGPDTAKIFSFDFEIPKGQDGAHTVSVSATGTSTNKVKYITIDGTESKLSALSDTEETAVSSAVSTSGMGWTGTDSTVHKVNSSYLNTVNNVTSTSTTDPLSANMGKELQDQISNLKNIGRFLAIWDCSTGLPLTNPTTLPYTYKTGDYYRVGTVAGTYTHTVSMSGTDYSSQSFSVQFSFTDSTSTAYSTVATLSDALYAQGHSQHSGTCPATGSCGSFNVGYVASDGGNNILLQDSTTAQIGMVLDDATGITITDTVTGGTTNYKPNGSTYDGTASTTVESETVEVGYVYYYDGTTWLAQSAGCSGIPQDVQINGTSILSAETGVANIPLATATTVGVVRPASAYGTGIVASTGALTGIANSTYSALQSGYTNRLMSKYDVDVINANENVKFNASQSLTTAQQLQARTNIGAGTPYTVTVDV